MTLVGVIVAAYAVGLRGAGCAEPDSLLSVRSSVCCCKQPRGLWPCRMRCEYVYALLGSRVRFFFIFGTTGHCQSMGASLLVHWRLPSFAHVLSCVRGRGRWMGVNPSSVPG